MRLGDLDALKEATKSFADCDGFNPVWQIIDNAPTVYPICEDKACKYRANERPQAEWTDSNDGKLTKFHGEWRYLTGGAYKCSLCRTITSTQYSYCPYCGAQMKGGAE